MIGPLCNLAALFTAAAVYRAAARRRGLATEGMLWISLVGLGTGLVGATLIHVLLLEVPGGHVQGGRSLYAGLIAGWLGVVWAKRRLGIRRPTGDLFALALAAGEAVGRLGCYANGCCYGLPCQLPWAVYQHDAWRHPSQLYQAAAAALGYLWLRRQDGRWPEGSLLWLYLCMFGSIRFLLEFVREGTHVAGLSLAQWVCIPLVAVGIRALARERSRR